MAHVGYPNRRPCGFIICFLVLLLVFYHFHVHMRGVRWRGAIASLALRTLWMLRCQHVCMLRMLRDHHLCMQRMLRYHRLCMLRMLRDHHLCMHWMLRYHRLSMLQMLRYHHLSMLRIFLKHFDNCCDDELRWKMVLGESSCVNPKNRQNQLRQNYQFGSFCL